MNTCWDNDFCLISKNDVEKHPIIKKIGTKVYDEDLLIVNTVQILNTFVNGYSKPQFEYNTSGQLTISFYYNFN